jgi:hypothetical protein
VVAIIRRPPMQKPKRRKCLCCKSLFRPDPRTANCQKYCSKPDCRAASKLASQRRWTAKAENREHFRGSVHVERVRAWREANPGYWKRSCRLRRCTLQDECGSQTTEDQADKAKNATCALQEEIFLQPAFLVGLIAQTIGSTLQDEIAESARRMQTRGLDILGRVPGSETVKRKVAS